MLQTSWMYSSLTLCSYMPLPDTKKTKFVVKSAYPAMAYFKMVLFTWRATTENFEGHKPAITMKQKFCNLTLGFLFLNHLTKPWLCSHRWPLLCTGRAECLKSVFLAPFQNVQCQTASCMFSFSLGECQPRPRPQGLYRSIEKEHCDYPLM